MAKRSQQDSGEERVTAKSKPMMNLIVRTLSFVSSSTSVSPGKRYYGNQDPWKSVVAEDRLRQLGKETENFSSTDHLKLDYDRVWSSQEWKAEVTTHDRSGQPDNINSQEVANSQNFIMGSDATEFVNRVNDQVRKRQKIMSNVAGEGEEHSKIWRMFMAVTMNSATFVGKDFQDNQNSIMNTTDLTLKQMFDITLKLVSEQDEINNLDKIHWGRNSWRQLSLIGDETIINLQRAKVYVFSDSVLCLGRIHQHPRANESWKDRIGWITTSQSYRDHDGTSGEPTEFEWNIFPGFTTLQLHGKVTDLLSRFGETPETFAGRILFMLMFNDISCDKKDNGEECLANAKVVSLFAKKFGIGKWSFIGPDSEKKWSSMEEKCPQGIWDHIAEKMLVEFAESGCPIFRATTPLSRGKLKSKGHGNCRFTLLQIKI